MADKVLCDVTLAHADLALLQCWKEKVSKGFECSLMLKHSKGRVTTILTSSSLKIPVPRKSKPAPKISAEVITRKKGLSKKRLEALLSYQKRLVEEKGLPPSRLMPDTWVNRAQRTRQPRNFYQAGAREREERPGSGRRDR